MASTETIVTQLRVANEAGLPSIPLADVPAWTPDRP